MSTQFSLTAERAAALLSKPVTEENSSYRMVTKYLSKRNAPLSKHPIVLALQYLERAELMHADGYRVTETRLQRLENYILNALNFAFPDEEFPRPQCTLPNGHVKIAWTTTPASKVTVEEVLEFFGSFFDQLLAAENNAGVREYCT